MLLKCLTMFIFGIFQAEIENSAQPKINQQVVSSTHFWIYLTYLTSTTKHDLQPKNAPKEDIRY